MFQSLKLGKFFGIDLYIHGTFWLLPLIVLFGDLSAGGSLAAAGGEIIFLFAVFGCIVLHEAGHALAARGFGVSTRNITLYPVGGVASLERMPEKPSQEIAIALAGPAVNFAIAGLLFIVLFASSILWPTSYPIAGAETLQIFAVKLMWANLVLGAFNLLPCFPMDGGRVLRALLALGTTRVRATAIAVGVGTVVAIGFVALGFYSGNYGLVALAMVVWLLGQAELAGVRAQAAERTVREWSWPASGATGAPAASDFTGLVWNDAHAVWVQYENGHVVRVIDPET
jgi:Zn-dependent protease